MHKRLESYLSEVAAGLQNLPEERRNEELQEIRQHLGALVESGLLLGETEDEAVAAAIRQFQQPNTLARDLKRVWYRGQLRGFWVNRGRTAMLGAAQGALLGLGVGALMDIVIAAGSGAIAAGWLGPLECLLASVALWALFMGCLAHSARTMSLPDGLKAGALMGFVAGAACVAASWYFKLYGGEASLLNAWNGTIEVLTCKVPTLGTFATGGTVYGSFYLLLTTLVFALAGTFWSHLFQGSQHISKSLAAE